MIDDTSTSIKTSIDRYLDSYVVRRGEKESKPYTFRDEIIENAVEIAKEIGEENPSIVRKLALMINITKERPKKEPDGRPKGSLRWDLKETKEDYFDENKFIPNQLAKAIERKYNFMTVWGMVYVYNAEKGIYEAEGEELIEEICRDILDDEYKKNRVTEVTYAIKIGNYQDYEEVKIPSHQIIVENGILDLEINELLPFSPKHFSTSRLPIIYDVEAKAEGIIKFLEEICPNSEFRQTLIEMIAYCLLNNHKYHVWLIIVGEGENGKTTYINLVKAFLGDENTVSISLQDLLTRRFLRAELFGKLANIYDEIPKTPLKYTGIIKILTGEGQITCDVKFKKPRTFTSTTKFIFSCNELPKTEDTTHAFFSRPMIIELTQRFPKGDPKTDPNLIEKLTTPTELSGLLNLCLDSMKQIEERKTISYPFTSNQMRDQYQRFSDPIYEYIQENVVFDAMESITKGKMYEDFVKYATKNKLAIMPSNVFSRKVKPQIVTLGGTDGYKGKDRAWKGVRLREAKKGIDEYRDNDTND